MTRNGNGGRVAIVTGASGAIGGAIAEALAAHDYRLYLVGRCRESLDHVCGSIGDSTTSVRADLQRDDDLRGLAGRVAEECGQLDALVHSAGVISTGTVATGSVDDLDRQYAVNVRAPYLLTQLCLPLLRASRGQVVFINSSAGVSARAGVGQYAASKHALRALTDSLRGEVNEDGVRVVGIYPGRTAGPMQEQIHAADGEEYHAERLLQPDDVAQAVINALHTPRTAEVTDVRIRPFLPSTYALSPGFAEAVDSALRQLAAFA